MDAFVIGLSGGSASGKTTVARKVIESLGVPWVTLLSMDSFYKVLTEEQHEMAAKNEYNFDHPGECSTVTSLRSGSMAQHHPLIDILTTTALGDFVLVTCLVQLLSMFCILLLVSTVYYTCVHVR
jgi:chloramphenicol 3-O-phosphotransferase